MLSEYLDKRQLRHTVCVATDYGEEVMEHTEYVQIRQGRLDVPEMEALMRSGDYAVVVDATHPYATAVSENVRMACKAVDMPYLRYLRDAGRVAGSKTSKHFDKREGCRDRLFDHLGKFRSRGGDLSGNAVRQYFPDDREQGAACLYGTDFRSWPSVYPRTSVGKCHYRVPKSRYGGKADLRDAGTIFR